MTSSTDTAIGGYAFHEGDRIRKAREELDLSQDALAERTGISRATLSTYERGGNVKRAYRRLLAMSLGVSVGWLETGSIKTENGTPDGHLSDVRIDWKTRRRRLPNIIPSLAA